MDQTLSQVPILVSQTIYIVSGTQDLQSIAGLMQVHQQAISNQIQLLSEAGALVALGITLVASLLGYVGYRELMKYVGQKATLEAERCFNVYRDNFVQDLLANLIDDDGNDTNNTSSPRTITFRRRA